MTTIGGDDARRDIAERVPTRRDAKRVDAWSRKRQDLRQRRRRDCGRGFGLRHRHGHQQVSMDRCVARA